MAERAHLAERRRQGPAYADDYAAWVEHQVALLRERRVDEIDFGNLIDEVEDLGKSEFRQFRSAIEIVLIHMLKWDYQPGHRSLSWQISIAEHRRRIEQELIDSPSYRARRDEAVAGAYRVAPLAAARETELRADIFPENCPYDWDMIVAREHLLPGETA